MKYKPFIIGFQKAGDFRYKGELAYGTVYWNSENCKRTAGASE